MLGLLDMFQFAYVRFDISQLIIFCQPSQGWSMVLNNLFHRGIYCSVVV